MKLYYSPGACSLAPHIVMHELGIEHTGVKVSTKTKQMEGGADFLSVNPKGQVPAIELDDGAVLTEVAAIVQYLADSKPDGGLIAPAGTLERYRVLEWLSFISTELHKSYGALFNPHASDDMRAHAVTVLKKKFAYVEQQLDGRDYLAGAQPTVADFYLFVVAGWHQWTKFDMTPYPHLLAFMGRIAARPAVQAAMRTEGLIS
jgi:glutathione S-transferase